MPLKILELITGNLEEKREYRRLMRRVHALPSEYRLAYKKIQNYMYYLPDMSCDLTMLTELVELFELNAASGRSVREVLGHDPAGFCDALVQASCCQGASLGERLNREIYEYFYKEDSDNASICKETHQR